MTDDTPDRKLTKEEQAKIREESLSYIREADITRRQVSNESGIPYGTLTSWFGNTYGAADGGSHIARAVTIWMKNREERKQLQAAAPRNVFVETPTASEIRQLLAHAHQMPDIVVVTGEPGIGKTAAVCAYTRDNPKTVFKITAEKAHNTVRAMLGELAQALGCHEGGSQHRISREIRARLMGTNALIIVDEAQHYTADMLDQLRAYYDQCGIGIALVGNDKINITLRGGRRAGEYAQLTRRVGLRLKRSRPRAGDVAALLDSWGVAGPDVRKTLQAIALQPGALGSMQKTYRMAQTLANATGRDLTAADVAKAYEVRAGAPLQQVAA